MIKLICMNSKKYSSCLKQWLVLKYSWFTMLWNFLLYNKVTQCYMYTPSLPFRFFSHTDYHRISGRVLRALQQIPTGQPFHISQCAYASPKPPVYHQTSLLVTVRLFSKSASLFFFCRQVNFILFFRFHI